MQQNSSYIKVISIILVIVMTSIPVTSLAQQLEEKPVVETYDQGKIDGEHDAKGHSAWILAGFGCGIIGAGVAYFKKPNPPAELLIGRSEEYIWGYIDGYQNKGRTKNLNYACGGWLVAALVILAISDIDYEENAF